MLTSAVRIRSIAPKTKRSVRRYSQYTAASTTSAYAAPHPATESREKPASATARPKRCEALPARLSARGAIKVAMATRRTSFRGNGRAEAIPSGAANPSKAAQAASTAIVTPIAPKASTHALLPANAARAKARPHVANAVTPRRLSDARHGPFDLKRPRVAANDTTRAMRAAIQAPRARPPSACMAAIAT